MRLQLTLVLSALLLSTTSVQAEDSELILSLADPIEKSLDASQVGFYESVLERRATRRPAIAEVKRPEVLATASTVRLELPDGAQVELLTERVDQRSKGDLSYFAQLRDGTGQAILVMQKGSIHGLVTSGADVFRIEPLGGTLHAIFEVDPTSFPSEHDDVGSGRAAFLGTSALGSEPADSPEEEPIENPHTMPQPFDPGPDKGIDADTIKVFVFWTQAVAARVANPAGLAQLAVDATNQAFGFSGVAPRVELIGSDDVNYTEVLTGTEHVTDLNRFRGASDGFMDGVHFTRNQFGADLMVLLTDNDTLCGRADQIGATATSAFATVYFDCAVGNFSLAHEIGHLAGCRHDNDGGNNPFAFGHGFSSAPGNFRTIMAIDPLARPRIQRFSNPGVFFGGRATGTAATNDCARVWDEREAVLRGFRADPNILASINAPYQVCSPQQVNVSASIVPPIPGCTVSGCTYNWTYRRCESPPYGYCSNPTYYPLSTSSSASTFLYPFTDYIDLRLTANCTLTCDGNACPASRTWNRRIYGPASCY